MGSSLTSSTENINQVKSIVKNNVFQKQTETIYDEGYGISSLWDAKYYDKLTDIFYDIRRGKIELLQDMVNTCIDLPKKGKEDFAPKISHAGHNVITHPGIALTNKNITGEDMTRFLYIFSGTDNSEQPTIYSTGIPNENARMSILDTGFYFASGTALFQGSVFPTTIEDAVVKAFGSSTHADPNEPGHTVFWVSRILDNTKFIYHFKNKTIYTHMHVIQRMSKASE